MFTMKFGSQQRRRGGLDDGDDDDDAMSDLSAQISPCHSRAGSALHVGIRGGCGGDAVAFWEEELVGPYGEKWRGQDD